MNSGMSIFFKELKEYLPKAESKVDISDQIADAFEAGWDSRDEEVSQLREGLGNMLDYYWGYRKKDGATDITDELAQYYQHIIEARIYKSEEDT